MVVPKTFIEVTVVENDRKGAVADVTNFIFTIGGNIEKVNQNVVRGLFGMQLGGLFSNDRQKKNRPWNAFASKKIGDGN